MYTQYKHYLSNGVNNYRVAIYARLSREDEKEYANPSESIRNQVDFLQKIVLENGWFVVDTYIDDGISGTTFDRPDFQRMIADVEKGRVNLIITKDLSRLGRDYVKTGYYLEDFFPSNNVRYIAVNDGFDTFDESNNNDFIPFKSVFNDMYAKDISKKVRTALKTKQITGSYLGTNAPYGYMKDPEQKGHLLIDPVSSEYVKMIFARYLAGTPLKTIATQLTIEKIPTPAQYAKINNPKLRFDGVWNDKTVRFMLKNEVYIGHTVQNKRKKVNYKLNKQVELPTNQWIKVENTHEPIMSLEKFQVVQDILAKRSFTPNKGQPHLLTGFITCGHCNTPYTYARQHKKGKFYILCGTAKRNHKLGLCKTHMVKEDVFLKFLLDTLKQIAQQYINPDVLQEKTQKDMFSDLLKTKQAQKQQVLEQLERIKKVAINLYRDKVSEVVSMEMFQTITAENEQEKERLLKKLAVLENEINNMELKETDSGNMRSVFESLLALETVDRLTLAKLIKKIVLYQDNTVEIYFTFREPVQKNIAS
ncbi:MAG: recombinase family protein [Oscillospiraceae bacterium]|nr:recombinase family protein [Oscillospiraceae bacterium]